MLDMSNWIVREARPDDAAGIAAVHVQGWLETYEGVLDEEVIRRNTVLSEREAQWHGWLADPQGQRVLVGEIDGRIVGFSVAGPARDEDAPVPLEFQTLYTLAETHGSGLGHALAEVLGDEDAYLWVVRGNPRAMKFHRKLGFEIEEPPVYRHNESDVRMVRVRS